SLIGRTVNPDVTQKLHFYVVQNTADAVWVYGDASAIAGLGDTYRMISFQLGTGSPCIDTATSVGAPSEDLVGSPRPQAAGIDMGAYESSATGSVVGVIYVDESAMGANNGSSWDHAFNDLQDGLALAQARRLANSDDLTIQVWVADGVYYPGVARTDSFVMVHRVPVYGGFAGTESSTSQRNIKANPTILSGDLNDDDAAGWANRSENSYHVVEDTNFTKSVRLDGFVIRGGNADGSAVTPTGQGGGMFSESAQDSVIANCTFIDNSAGGGGGLYLKKPRVGNTTVWGCTFSGNRSTEAGNDVGGGGLSGHGTSGVEDSWVTVTRCIFTGNSAPGSIGGGAHLGAADTALRSTFVNCLVAGNQSGYTDGGPQGGGLDLRGTNVTIQNCTLAYNEPYGLTTKDNVASARNTIIWSNTTSELLILNNTLDPRFSNIDETGYSGVNGNIRQDPEWVGAPSGAWTLAGVYDPLTGLTVLTDAGAGWLPGEHQGRVLNPNTVNPLQYMVCTNGPTTITVWGDASDGGLLKPYQIYDYQLSGTSPSIDAGSSLFAPSDDLEGANRPAGSAHDQGAYEFGGSSAFTGGVVYVDIDATGADDGSSWANAFTNLQDAILAAPVGREIWVAEGTYTPGVLSSDSYVLKPNVPVYGGFAAIETTRGARDWKQNCTILSGDLAGNDGDDNLQSAPHANRADNARHVVTAVDFATLDGFVIIGGYAYHVDPGNPDYYGGGVLINGTSPTIENCLLVDNFGRGGGAMGILAGAAPIIRNCSFSANVSEAGGAAYSDGQPLMDRCTFAGSTATFTGGALFFEGNYIPRVQNCLFAGGYSEFDGAIRVSGDSGSNGLEVVNSTLTENQATFNGAIYVKRDSQPVVWNSILWKNNATGAVGVVEIGIDPAVPLASIDVSYSDVTGGFVGTGNIDADPQFLGGPDGTWDSVGAFDLAKRQSTLTDNGASWQVNQFAGQLLRPSATHWRQYVIAENTATTITIWGSITGVAAGGSAYQVNNFDIKESSPCADTGVNNDIPNRDILGRNRPTGSNVDMGAFEVAVLDDLSLMLIIY
ncbi:MAG: right-handed parallel beta-helix repeat-containing protein, partial [Verrucomicrobia bacterium]|nr:right-handed parallel beta-helix repeat-containing protein [Verrucomicrobiota bacterium]